MDHIAIMKKSFGFVDKILSGQKKIESRWYNTRRRPWNSIKIGETIYFKDSGGLARAKAEIKKILRFSDLTTKKVYELLNKYGENIGIEKKDQLIFFENFKHKKYCILIFLRNSASIKPFKISKIGHGAMSGWITLANISKLPKEN